MNLLSSAHAWVIATLKYENFNRIVVINWGTLYLKDQYLSYIVFGWHLPLIRHVLFQLQIHKELTVCLAVYEVLSYDVIGTVWKTFIWYCFDLQSKVEVTQVFEGNRRHPDLIFLCWDFYDRCILVWFVEILYA